MPPKLVWDSTELLTRRIRGFETHRRYYNETNIIDFSRFKILINMKKKCEQCQSEIDGTFGSGRFCNRTCSNRFVSLMNRSEKNKKVAKSLRDRNPKRVLASVVKVCPVCDAEFSITYPKKDRKTCSRKCEYFLTASHPNTRAAVKEAALTRIKKGNIGYGIRSSCRGVRCDSALEYTFLRWYWNKHPDAKISRFPGSLTDGEITYIPDFLVDGKIAVEVKCEKVKGCFKLSQKWDRYIDSQPAKRKLLEEFGDHIWFTETTCGMKFYRDMIREVKLSQRKVAGSTPAGGTIM